MAAPEPPSRPQPAHEPALALLARPGAPEPEPVTGASYAALKVQRSISEGRMDPGRPKPPATSGSTVLVGLLLVLGAFVLYWLSNLPPHWNFYNHFVWQADAFLHGRAWIPFPVPASAELPGNAYFQDLYPITTPDGGPAGRVLIPFPPLPALVLVPFVALAGLCPC